MLFERKMELIYIEGRPSQSEGSSVTLCRRPRLPGNKWRRSSGAQFAAFAFAAARERPPLSLEEYRTAVCARGTSAAARVPAGIPSFSGRTSARANRA